VQVAQRKQAQATRRQLVHHKEVMVEPEVRLLAEL
jgi:hypothetical protein